MRRSRRGQSTVEYMLLLCTGVTIVVIVGGFLQKYLPQIEERVIDQITEAAFALARP